MVSGSGVGSLQREIWKMDLIPKLYRRIATQIWKELLKDGEEDDNMLNNFHNFQLSMDNTWGSLIKCSIISL